MNMVQRPEVGRVIVVNGVGAYVHLGKVTEATHKSIRGCYTLLRSAGHGPLWQIGSDLTITNLETVWYYEDAPRELVEALAIQGVIE